MLRLCDLLVWRIPPALYQTIRSCRSGNLFIQTLRNLGPMRLGAIALVAFIAGFLWLSDGTYIVIARGT